MTVHRPCVAYAKRSEKVRGCRTCAEPFQIFGKPAHIGRNGHAIVIQDQSNLCAECARMTERF